jgi:hypothetical protein
MNQFLALITYLFVILGQMNIESNIEAHRVAVVCGIAQRQAFLLGRKAMYLV